MNTTPEIALTCDRRLAVSSGGEIIIPAGTTMTVTGITRKKLSTREVILKWLNPRKHKNAMTPKAQFIIR